jgi:hypothetical protein
MKKFMAAVHVSMRPLAPLPCLAITLMEPSAVPNTHYLFAKPQFQDAKSAIIPTPPILSLTVSNAIMNTIQIMANAHLATTQLTIA